MSPRGGEDRSALDRRGHVGANIGPEAWPAQVPRRRLVLHLQAVEHLADAGGGSGQGDADGGVAGWDDEGRGDGRAGVGPLAEGRRALGLVGDAEFADEIENYGILRTGDGRGSARGGEAAAGDGRTHGAAGVGRLAGRDGGAGKRTAGGDLPGDADGGNFIAQPREHDGAATGGEIPWIAGAGSGEAAGEGQRLLGLAAAGKEIVERHGVGIEQLLGDDDGGGAEVFL